MHTSDLQVKLANLASFNLIPSVPALWLQTHASADQTVVALKWTAPACNATTVTILCCKQPIPQH